MTETETNVSGQGGEREAVHQHADGLFCDECPGALRQNIKRILAMHRWGTAFSGQTTDCSCGWMMPYTETHQHLGHLADVLAKELAYLGWTYRPTPPEPHGGTQ